MFFALDENGIRVNAEDGVFNKCICPACRKPVIQKRGDTNRHHFAHNKKESSCPFNYNKDYINMSEWHIRMQDYFPKEQREHIFTDAETVEKHIADVYIEESKTVLEFQYSTIKLQEFLSRTNFHLKEGRRIAWLFDESWKDAKEDSYNKKFHKNGKLEKAHRLKRDPYSPRTYKWLYRRKVVEDGPPIYNPRYSVCLFTGAEGDLFHRIINMDGEIITVSLHDISMSTDLNVEELFCLEPYWQRQEPWKDEFERLGSLRLFEEYDLEPIVKQRNEIEIMDIGEAMRLHEQAIRMKRIEKERRDREDYWAALLDYADNLKY